MHTMLEHRGHKGEFPEVLTLVSLVSFVLTGLSLSLLFMATLGAAATPSIVSATRQGDHAELRALLLKHPDVNAAEPDGTTALLWAVQPDDVESVGLLLGAKANAGAANRYGETPLSVACTNGNVAII